jgi:hypothetical protein
LIVDREDEITDVDLVSWPNDQRGGDFATVDVRSVGALEVDNNESTVFKHDP